MINKTQINYLQARVRTIARTKQNELLEKEPIEIIEARAIIKVYEENRRERSMAKTKIINSYADKVIDTLHFKTEPEIMRAIQDFEDVQFK
jgi:hypothetical protein